MNDGQNLVKYQTERSRKKREAVEHAVQKLVKRRKPFSLNAVAMEACVTPQFIYQNPDLLKLVKDSMTAKPSSGRPAKHNGNAVKETLEASYKRIMAENDALKRENERLRKNENYAEKFNELKQNYDALLRESLKRRESDARKQYGIVGPAMHSEKDGTARVYEAEKSADAQINEWKKKYESKYRECEELKNKLNSLQTLNSASDDDDVIDMGMGSGTMSAASENTDKKYKA